MGNVCNYDRLPATPECPFPVQDILTLPFVENPALWEGSSSVTQNPDGTETPATTDTPHCQHDAAFFANPDYAALIAQQQWEIVMRNVEAGLITPEEAAGLMPPQY